MKKYTLFLSTVIAIIGFLGISNPAHAVVLNLKSVVSNVSLNQAAVQIITTPTLTPTPTIKIVIPIKPIKLVTITLKKTNALNEIDRRLTSLSGLSDKINAIQRITDVQRVTLLTQVQLEINSLTDLKTKINAETDATALKAEKQSIVDGYRIYALFVPKVEIIVNADKMLSIADALSGKTSDATLQQTITNSKNEALSVIDLVMPLAPEDYPGNKPTLLKARDMLKEARNGLTTVYTTLNKK